LPWDIRITYNLGLNRGTGKKFIPSHTANFAGSLTPTRYWTLGVTSGFDFTTQKISYTSLNVTRDLKCWQATIAWVPFGLNKNYSVFIGLKSSMLSDFKIPRQKPWFDAFL
jgi:hypothetical protein